MELIEVFDKKDRKIKISKEALAISLKNKDGKYHFYDNRTKEALERAVGYSQYERDFSVGYSQAEYQRLIEKFRKSIEPIAFIKKEGNIEIKFSDFVNRTGGFYQGYQCVRGNNLGLGARGETVVVTKQQLLEGLKEGLRSYLEWVEPILKTVPWRTEEKEQKINQYEIDKMLIINLKRV